jgi:hypothetical protein
MYSSVFCSVGLQVCNLKSPNLSLDGVCQIHSNMWDIVGFRKIISFKIGIKNIPSYLKNKVDI